MRTSQKTLPSASTAASPLELDLEAFLDTLMGLSSPDSSLAMKLLRRLPMVDMRWVWWNDVKVVGEVESVSCGIKEDTRVGRRIALWMGEFTKTPCFDLKMLN